MTITPQNWFGSLTPEQRLAAAERSQLEEYYKGCLTDEGFSMMIVALRRAYKEGLFNKARLEDIPDLKRIHMDAVDEGKDSPEAAYIRARHGNPTKREGVDN